MVPQCQHERIYASLTESDQPAEPKRNLVRQGAVVASMTLLSRISGFVRDVVFANVFGAGFAADAFFVAFRIPNFFRRLFAEGAFNQAFVPVLARFRQEPQAVLRAFVSRIFGNLGLIVGAVVVLGVVFAEPLVWVFAPGFADDGPRAVLAVELVRITFPYLGLITLVALSGAILNSHDRFAVPAVTPVLMNLCLIGAALWAALNSPGQSSVVAVALAWGVLVAGCVQLAVQIPALAPLGLLTPPRLSYRDPGVREVGRLLVPAVLAASVAQINTLVDTILASQLVAGSISWLYYADRLLELPVGLVAVALGTVLLPNLSRLAAKENFADFRKALAWGVNAALLLAFPAAVALYLLATPLLASMLLHGEMQPLDIQLAALALQAFAPGLVGWVLVKVLAPGFFARKDTTTPFRIGVVAVLVNIVLNFALYRTMGHVGLALATSASGLVNAGLLAHGLAARGYLVADKALWLMLGKILLACLGMAALLLTLTPDQDFWLQSELLPRVGWLLLLVTAGGAVYAGILLLLGVRPSHLRLTL